MKKVNFFLVYNTLFYFPSVATFMTFVLLHKTLKVKNKVLSICQKNYSVFPVGVQLSYYMSYLFETKATSLLLWYLHLGIFKYVIMIKEGAIYGQI